MSTIADDIWDLMEAARPGAGKGPARRLDEYQATAAELAAVALAANPAPDAPSPAGPRLSLPQHPRRAERAGGVRPIT